MNPHRSLELEKSACMSNAKSAIAFSKNLHVKNQRYHIYREQYGFNGFFPWHRIFKIIQTKLFISSSPYISDISAQLADKRFGDS